MSNTLYDIITIGGGIAASSLARAMARHGARVLVLERETQFKDRVRGEVLLPWGVGEARTLGVYDLLLETCAHEQPWFDVFLGNQQLMHRNLPATTPQQAPMCSFYHPAMQEVLIRAAQEAGAEVQRGAIVTGIEPGPVVKFEGQNGSQTARARMVVAADGRIAPSRKWWGFNVRQDPPSLLMAGVLLDNVNASEDVNFILHNPATCQGAYIFPQGGRRARAYFAYPISSGYRLHGEADAQRFFSESVRTGVPEEYYRDTKVSGPLASFETADSWVPYPYRNGVALLGDAAAASDPSWGNGLSLALSGARILRDCLQGTDDWDHAGRQYAERVDHLYDVIHSVTTWSRQIFMENGPEADARRAKAMPLIAEDPSRVPDHGISGPNLPFDKEMTRARFFGEV